MPRVLLIDDDENLAPPLAEYLRRFDLELEAATRPSAGFARLAQGGIDAVILDVMLPEMDGFEVCRRIRATSDVPVLMLTARGELSDRVVGLELGADDYLAKPFEPRELAARLATILRRARAPSGTVLRFEGLAIDTVRGQSPGAVKGLSQREFAPRTGCRDDQHQGGRLPARWYRCGVCRSRNADPCAPASLGVLSRGRVVGNGGRCHPPCSGTGP